jgi:hypothetical protein
MIKFVRYTDAMHWRIEIPISQRTYLAWHPSSDTLRPLRKFWTFTWKREAFCGGTEIRIRFGMCYQ